MRWACLILAVATLVSGYSTPQSPLPTQTRATNFLVITSFATWQKRPGPGLHETTLTSPEFSSPIAWDELVMSWNATAPPGTGLKFEARAIYPERATAFYALGIWAEDTAERPRGSILHQKDQDGDVLTDTLVLKRLANRLQLRITFTSSSEQLKPVLKFVGLSFIDTKITPLSQPPNTNAWGKSLPVPERSQLSYSSGRDWCSPTSVSMVLSYWSMVLKRPELNVDVPEVAGGVFDKNWPGTGNWPFNTAFAGKFNGMRAYVTRLEDLAELESLIAAGVPPILSVSYDLLYDRPPGKSSGHLVVCIGFTTTGDAVINDPWANFSKGDKVRQIIPRQRLAKAWAHSHRTIYLIRPETWPAK